MSFPKIPKATMARRVSAELAERLKDIEHIGELIYHPPKRVKGRGIEIPKITFTTARITIGSTKLSEILKKRKLRWEVAPRELTIYHPKIEAHLCLASNGRTEFEISPSKPKEPMNIRTRKNIVAIIKALTKLS